MRFTPRWHRRVTSLRPTSTPGSSHPPQAAVGSFHVKHMPTRGHLREHSRARTDGWSGTAPGWPAVGRQLLSGTRLPDTAQVVGTLRKRRWIGIRVDAVAVWLLISRATSTTPAGVAERRTAIARRGPRAAHPGRLSAIRPPGTEAPGANRLVRAHPSSGPLLAACFPGRRTDGPTGWAHHRDRLPG